MACWNRWMLQDENTPYVYVGNIMNFHQAYNANYLAVVNIYSNASCKYKGGVYILYVDCLWDS